MRDVSDLPGAAALDLGRALERVIRDAVTEALGTERPRTWVSYKKAAERLGVAPNSVAKLVRQGYIVGVDVRGLNRAAVDSASLDRYMASCEVDLSHRRDGAT